MAAKTARAQAASRARTGPAAPGGAAWGGVGDLGAVGDLVSGQTSAIGKAIYYVFLVAGVGLSGYGLVNVMMDGKRQQPTGAHWMMVLIGGALASLTAVIGVMSGTLLGSGQTGISNIGL